MGVTKDIYDVIKDVALYAKSLQNQEFHSKIIDIQSEFFNMKEQYHKLYNENVKLKRRIEEIENIKKIQKDLLFTNKGYFTKTSEGEKSLIYCTKCYLTKKIIIPMMIYGAKGCYICQECKTEVFTEQFYDIKQF